MDNTDKASELRKLISLAKKDDDNGIISLVDKFITVQPENAELYYTKARYLIKKKDYDDALKTYNQAISLKPNETKFYDQKAFVLYKLKKYREAVEVYNQAILLKPEETKLYDRKAFMLSKLNRKQEAVKVYDQIIKKMPDYAPAYNNKGILLSKIRQNEAAIETYNQAIKKRPDYAPAYNNKGILLSKLKRYEAAIEAYDQAIKKMPDYAPAYNNKAIALGKWGHAQILNLTSKNIAGFLSIINSVRFEVAIPTGFSITDEILESFKAYEYNPNFKKIIKDANEDVKIALIHFMVSIHNFKCSRLLSSTDSNKNFYQYTSLNTLKSLLNLKNQEATDKTKINIRLYNTDYMNDPEEGNTLINYLNGGAKHNNSKILASHTFISSLTPHEKKDEIPMWRMYGDDYHGVSIGFKGFPRWSKNSTLDYRGDFEEKSMDHLETLPQMYKVYYLDERRNLSSRKDSELKSLKEKYDILRDTKEKFCKEATIIDNFINFELEQVKFLVKDKRYEYEGEVRLVQTVQSFDKAKYEMNSPKLFLEYNNDLNKRSLEIVEIIFGVNSDLLENWLAIIEKKIGCEVSVTKSTVNYRSK